jgi:hypothetical protein
LVSFQRGVSSYEIGAPKDFIPAELFVLSDGGGGEGCALGLRTLVSDAGTKAGSTCEAELSCHFRDRLFGVMLHHPEGVCRMNHLSQLSVGSTLNSLP